MIAERSDLAIAIGLALRSAEDEAVMIKVNLLIDHTVVRKRKSFVNLGVADGPCVRGVLPVYSRGNGNLDVLRASANQTGTERRERPAKNSVCRC